MPFLASPINFPNKVLFIVVTFRPEHEYCIGVSRRSAQGTAGKGLAQGPYVAARAGVEPTTLRLRVIASTNAPSRPTGALPAQPRSNNVVLKAKIGELNSPGGTEIIGVTNKICSPMNTLLHVLMTDDLNRWSPETC